MAAESNRDVGGRRAGRVIPAVGSRTDDIYLGNLWRWVRDGGHVALYDAAHDLTYPRTVRSSVAASRWVVDLVVRESCRLRPVPESVT